MRAVIITISTVLRLAAAHAIEPRDPPHHTNDEHSDDEHHGLQHWPHKPHKIDFFNLAVDDRCDPYASESYPPGCLFEGYSIKLLGGSVLAVPNDDLNDHKGGKLRFPKTPVFWVNSKTELYTASKIPYRLYVDSVTGALKYAPLKYTPPTAITTGFYKTGNNPERNVDPSPAYLTWPVTPYVTNNQGKWWICELEGTGQYQVFVLPDDNFVPSGVVKQSCDWRKLAALNVNPFHNHKHHKGHHTDSDSDSDSDSDDEHHH